MIESVLLGQRKSQTAKKALGRIEALCPDRHPLISINRFLEQWFDYRSTDAL
jgi:hypothetical protein